MLIKTKARIKSEFFKVYSLNLEDREIIKKEFNEMHRRDKIK